MKKIYLLILTALVCLSAQSQDQPKEPAAGGKKFTVGVSYSYMSLDMKLTDMSLHSVWAGQDMGTYDLSSAEIDDLNSFADRLSTMNSICVEAGMSFLNKPDSKWRLDGNLILGLADIQKNIYNNNSEKEEYNYKSGFSKPYLGIGFDISYQFNPKWGLEIKPLFNATMGKNSDITDNINLVPENFTQTLDDKYSSFYERLSLMGSFTTGNLKLSAGPGFYWVNANHEYIIEQTNMTNGDIIRDEINSKSVARGFIDGSIAVEWKITGPIMFSAIAGIGNDVFIKTGIHYNF